MSARGLREPGLASRAGVAVHGSSLRSGLFLLGDYLAGAVIGAVTAVAVRSLIAPGFDLALAMLAGIGLGTLVHLVVGLMLSPLLGMFHVMVPGSLIGMYGGRPPNCRDCFEQEPALYLRNRALAFGPARHGRHRSPEPRTGDANEPRRAEDPTPLGTR